MHGFLPQDGISPSTFLSSGRAELSRCGGTVIDGTVTSLSAVPAAFRANLAEGTDLTARRVLVATGLRDVLPDIPGVRARWGKDLLHCPYCHGWEVRDQPIGVLGGNAEAVHHALLLRQWSSDVEVEALAARGVQIALGGVQSLFIHEDAVTGVRLHDGSVVARTALFVRPQFRPNAELLVDIGCEMDRTGWVIHDPTGRTSVDGVWVAGNTRDARAQVITAAGEGSAAAIAINADLIDADVATALDQHRASSRSS